MSRYAVPCSSLCGCQTYASRKVGSSALCPTAQVSHFPFVPRPVGVEHPKTHAALLQPSSAVVSAASSEQAPFRSLPHMCESLLTTLFLLSPQVPLLPAAHSTAHPGAHPKPPQSRCPGLPCPSHSPSLMSRTEPTVCRALQASLLRLGAAQLPPLTLLSPQTPDPAPFPRTLGNWPGCCSESSSILAAP